jgi:peptidoglycan hydrolase-like protein with peptidoglycan-binding domain
VRAISAVLAALLGTTLLAAPVRAAGPSHPGNFTGYAFDTCDAPSQRKMDDWHRASKYAGIGIYIAGINRACKAQPNLTRRWVAEQERDGWRLLPLVVGRQAACAPDGRYRGKRISSSRADGYAKAHTQGRDAAKGGARAARALGIAKRSVIWFDLEHFDTDKKRCRLSALTFVSGWTRTLHRLGYRSGFYSSASSGIAMLDDARRATPRKYAYPDYLWVAEWNGRDTVRSAYLSRRSWWPHRRVHQYRGPHTENHAGSRINVDSNFLSTGRGTTGGKAKGPCRVRVDFPSYRRLERRDRGARVAAAQCLLKVERHYRGRLHGRFDKATLRAVRSFQRGQAGVATSGAVTTGTWTSLLSQGDDPLLKYGAGGRAVRRLQRALNAATDAELRIDGVFAKPELRAVDGFQRQSGRRHTGVVTASTWRQLRKGVTVGRLASPVEVGVSEFFEGVERLTGVPFSSGAVHR